MAVTGRKTMGKHKLTAKSRKKKPLFKGCVIHRPTNEAALKQIHKTIAAFRCNAAIRYMDTLNLDDEHKAAVIDGLLADSKKSSEPASPDTN